jgi:hypothetical protein
MSRTIHGRAMAVLAAAVLVPGLIGCGSAAGSDASEKTPQELAVQKTASSRYAQQVAMFAEGVVDGQFVLPPGSVPPPPPGIEFRARYTFPVDGKDVLEGLVFGTAIGTPIGGPPLFKVSQFLVKVERFERSNTPAPNLAFFGRVIETPVPSPFGDIVGRLTAVTGGFTEGSDASFTLLGGPVSGSHVTVLPSASGSLTFRNSGADD